MRAFSTATRGFGHAAGVVAEAALIVAVVAALLFAYTVATGEPAGTGDLLAGNTAGPTLSIAMPASAGSRSSAALTVNGRNFTPSNLGQQVILWVGYPDNYCGSAGCHGFYAYPNVGDDGTFSVTYDNVVLQSGTGTVKGIQYNAKRDKWVTVDTVSYTAP